MTPLSVSLWLLTRLNITTAHEVARRHCASHLANGCKRVVAVHLFLGGGSETACSEGASGASCN